MYRTVTAGDVYHRVRYAAGRGVPVQWNGAVRWTAYQASRCERPLVIEWTGRGEREGAFAPGCLRARLEPWRSVPYVGRDKRGPLRLLDQWIACRTCKWCLQVRARQWSERMVQEVVWGQRTWFGTLTLNPQSHYVMECRAGERLNVVNPLDGTLSHNIYSVNREISKEITLWLKRLRKQSRAKLRYVIVAELHKSGRLHYHILVTEQPGSAPVRYKDLKAQWRLGFSAWKLVKSGGEAAGYVSKYLAKSSLARVRASRAYGSPPAFIAALAGSASSHSGERNEVGSLMYQENESSARVTSTPLPCGAPSVAEKGTANSCEAERASARPEAEKKKWSERKTGVTDGLSGRVS